MLPHHVAVLDAMPLTANGKLDRNRLKELPWETQLQTAKSTPPANEQERKIVEVFAHVLGVNAMGVEDNFFDLGGDSLLAVVALQALGDSIGMRIPPHVLFQSGTARGLATDIAGGVPSASRPMLLNRVGEGPAVYAISGAPYTYRRLGELLDGHCTLYGVLAQSELGAFDGSDDNRSIETQARDYVAVIRRQQRSGPYWLLGYSFAGIVAYETAQQLRDAGEEVRFLALIDPHLPEWDFGWRYRVSQFRRMLSAPRKDVLAFLARRIRARLDPFTDEAAAKYYQFVERHDNDELNALEMRRYASTTRASSRYLPHIRPYPWNVSLIVSAERLRDDPLKSPTCGWGPYIASLDVSSVDGPHLRMMFDEPHVSGIAEILAEAVKKARVPDTAH
jgi:thioesterase domain-containing protein